MTPRRFFLLAGLLLSAAGAVVACTLQPQPLPPSPSGLPDESTDDDDKSNGGSFETPPPGAQDAGPIQTPEDGGPDASFDDDGGDAGDGG